ncbi:MAG: right-handed parallel beta-helix repeat-containing protein [Planctomycetes bacterium]|nr:right-handed parallel beta-helix repeat-containing protein [Planctomycetota bacterium]
MRRFMVVACALVCLQLETVSAREIFVDNLVGSDTFDGLLDRPVDSGSGPVRTLHRAMKLVKFGDVITLSREGGVYYDSLALTGTRNSGSAQFPFTINGNGATLSGLRAVNPQGWRKAGPDLWKLTLTRKGFYRLLRDGRPLPETRHEGISPLANLPEGSWTAWQGSIYFHSDGEQPATEAFSYAADQTGLSLYQVSNVHISNLTLRDFRFDGINAQNMCEGITLSNVNCINNGRAGLAVSGTSHVQLDGGSMAENGRFQVRIAKPAGVTLNNVTMEGEPTIVP